MGLSPRAIGSQSSIGGNLADADPSPPPPPPACVAKPGTRVIRGNRQAPVPPIMEFIKIMAKFRANSPPLACEGHGGIFEAGSAAWINAQDSDGAIAQLGWARQRESGTTNITRFVYIELIWGIPPFPIERHRIWKFQDPGSELREYRMELDSGTGEWKFYFGGNQKVTTDYPQEAKDSWKASGSATQARWACEIHDLESHMPGTP